MDLVQCQTQSRCSDGVVIDRCFGAVFEQCGGEAVAERSRSGVASDLNQYRAGGSAVTQRCLTGDRSVLVECWCDVGSDASERGLRWSSVAGLVLGQSYRRNEPEQRLSSDVPVSVQCLCSDHELYR